MLIQTGQIAKAQYATQQRLASMLLLFSAQIAPSNSSPVLILARGIPLAAVGDEVWLVNKKYRRFGNRTPLAQARAYGGWQPEAVQGKRVF